ncbi:MAG TPA: hypothetical protein VLG40_03350 [Candidatus Saccharimonas sp.]|nr:hypothetical protein [Candidatus Saccharimonas sp.]
MTKSRAIRMPTDLAAIALRLLFQRLTEQIAYGADADNLSELLALKDRTDKILGKMTNANPDLLDKTLPQPYVHDEAFHTARVRQRLDEYLAANAEMDATDSTSWLDASATVLRHAVPRMPKIDESFSVFEMIDVMSSHIVPEENRFLLLHEVLEISEREIPPTLLVSRPLEEWFARAKTLYQLIAFIISLAVADRFTQVGPDTAGEK